jgi:hypothetical protein
MKDILKEAIWEYKKVEREDCASITVERHMAVEGVAYEDKDPEWIAGYRTACKDIHDLIMEKDDD